jgi:DNA gyrase subunit A
MIINKSGLAIRTSVSNLRVMGRATQGVRLINLKNNDSIAAVAKVINEEEDVEDVAGDATPEITDQNEDGTTIANDSEE